MNRITKLIILCLLAGVSFSGSANQTIPPTHVLSIGVKAPAEFYVTGITFDAAGNIYLADAFHRHFQKRDANFNLIYQQKVDGAVMLRDVAVDSDGNIYLVDLSLNKIYKYSAAGSPITEWGGDGKGDGLFKQARGILIDSQNRIIIAAGNQNFFQVFDLDGNFLFRVGEGLVTRPHDMTQDSLGNYYAADGNYVYKLDSSFNYIKHWGPDGTTATAFDWAAGIEVDANDNIFVNDRRRYVVEKFDTEGNPLASFGSFGYGPGQFSESHGLAISGSGNVWVAGYHGHDVQEFANNGTFVAEHQGRESGPGEFSDVKGVAVDAYGDIYVAEQWNNRIQKFDPEGNFILTWGKRGDRFSGNFNFPDGVTVWNNEVYVVNGSADVKRFGLDGEFRQVMGYESTWSVPQDLSLDSYGYIYVANTYLNSVIKIDPNLGIGEEVLKWGQKGVLDGEFDQPWGLHVDELNHVYVVDKRNRRIQVFDENGGFLRSWGERGYAPGQVQILQDLEISADGKVFAADKQRDLVHVYDKQGNFLHDIGDGFLETPWGVAVDGSYVLYVGQDYTGAKGAGRLEKYVYDRSFNPNGQAVGVADGWPFYTISRVQATGEWTLEWAGGDSSHDFEGIVTSAQGFVAVATDGFEGNDIFVQEPTRFSFTARAGEWKDSVKFSLMEGDSISFELKIDGVRRHSRIYIGAENAKAVNFETSLQEPALPPGC